MKVREKRKDQIERKKPGRNDTSWQRVEQRNQDSHAKKKAKQRNTSDTQKIPNTACQLSNKQQQSK
jgi:hypothetical protein